VCSPSTGLNRVHRLISFFLRKYDTIYFPRPPARLPSKQASSWNRSIDPVRSLEHGLGEEQELGSEGGGGGGGGVEHPGVERVEDDRRGAAQRRRQLGALDEGLGVRVHAEVDQVQLLLAEGPVPALQPRRDAQLPFHRPPDLLRGVELVVGPDVLLGQRAEDVRLLPQVEGGLEVVQLLQARADAVAVPRALPVVHAVGGRALELAPVVIDAVLDLVQLVSVEGFAVAAPDDGLVDGQVEGLEALDEEILRRVAVLGHAAAVVAVLAVRSRPLHAHSKRSSIDSDNG